MFAQIARQIPYRSELPTLWVVSLESNIALTAYQYAALNSRFDLALSRRGSTLSSSLGWKDHCAQLLSIPYQCCSHSRSQEIAPGVHAGLPADKDWIQGDIRGHCENPRGQMGSRKDLGHEAILVRESHISGLRSGLLTAMSILSAGAHSDKTLEQGGSNLTVSVQGGHVLTVEMMGSL